MKKMKKRNGSPGRLSSPESRLGRPDVQSRLSARDRRRWGQTPTEGRGSVPDDSLTGRAVHIQGACPSLAGLVEGQEILNKRARKSGGRSAGVEQDTVIAAGPRACIVTWRAVRGGEAMRRRQFLNLALRARTSHCLSPSVDWTGDSAALGAGEVQQVWFLFPGNSWIQDAHTHPEKKQSPGWFQQ